MIPKLFAFDLDGTLLNSSKKISLPNALALKEMVETGAIVAFASGRLGSSMQQYVSDDFDLPMLTLNGAAVYMGKKHNSRQIYHAPLAREYADFLLKYSEGKCFGVNYYINDCLYSVQTAESNRWLDLYFEQTATVYHFIKTFDEFKGYTPSKILLVGAADEIDRQEAFFRDLWKDSIYICRTWDYYLEFLNPEANKGTGLQIMADAYGIDIKDVVAFGDSLNDIPMLQAAGQGIAVSNALTEVKNAASRVSAWSNDENAVAREWEIFKGNN